MIEETLETNDNKRSDSSNMSGKETPEDEHDIEKRKKQSEIDENPDLEDPRLYSPLQEPDRPSPSERVHEEEDESGKTESSSEKEENDKACE
jgi:hypothetical protein